MSDIETKIKIMEAARILFADRGYEGTSVRDIAKDAGVNVASVNYYFSSKEKLFQEILQTAYVDCASEIKDILNKNQGNLEETLVIFFKYLLENSPDLLSHFKMMMSSQHNHHMTSQGTDDGIYGPPGGMVLAGALKKEVPGISDENLYWALKTLFSHVTHLSLIHTCCLKTNPDIPYSTQEDLEKSIRRLTKIVLRELKES
jgi:hypothetical protein